MISLLNRLGMIWAPVFGLAVVQNTLFLGIVLIILRMMRKTPAYVQYTILAIGLAKLLIPPFFRWPAADSALGSLGNVFVSGSVFAEGSVSPDLGTGLTIFGILLSFWLVGVLSIVAVRVGSTFRLMRTLRSAETIPSLPGIRVRKSDGIVMPLTLGPFPRTIYVPALWDRWTQDCRRLVLAHELAHIRRKDGLVQAFQIVVHALYFFHPMVWILCRRMDRVREMACDDRSVAETRWSCIRYSRFLVQIADHIGRKRLECSSASALMRHKNELFSRIQYQTREVSMNSLSNTKKILAVSLLVLFILPLSWTCSRKKPASESGLSLGVAVDKPVSETDTAAVPLVAFDQPPAPIGGTKTILEHLTYPEIAKRAGIQGVVEVKAYILASGEVAQTEIKKSLHPACDEAAADAIRAVRWSPALYQEKPVAVWIKVPVKFKLENKAVK